MPRGQKLAKVHLLAMTKISPGAFHRAVDSLIEKGLMNEEEEKVFPRRKLISLTRYGTEVAEFLYQVEDRLRKAKKLAEA